MSKGKILLVCCDGLENGGIQNVMMSIARNLNEIYTFEAVVFNPGDQFYSKEFRSFGKIHYFKRYKANNALGKLFAPIINWGLLSSQFNSLFRNDSNYIAIHCHNYFLAGPILKIAEKYGIRIRIAHSHNVESPFKSKNPLYNLSLRIYKKMIHNYATDRIACSKAAGEYLFGNDKIRVINNAIDLCKFDPHKYDVQAVDDNRVRFIHVGRYSYQKNQLFILEVLKEYIELDDSARLTLIGFGSMEADVMEEIKNYGLEKYVTILPQEADVPFELAKSNVFIFPSTYEGLGISLIEAQAMGLKCYVSEMIQPEANLGLCTVLRLDLGAKAWASYIYNDIQKNGIKKTFVNMQPFNINCIIEEYNDLYSGKLL